ncbi:MAG: hypothetical protein IT449_03205 [Phycisphaerales bacterium]|nr:hypothetical protein [Phycisphaerales bacterium]
MNMHPDELGAIAKQPDAGDSPAPREIADARRFIAGTGRMFSLLGLVLMLVSGCIGLFGGGLLDRPAEPAEAIADYFSPQRLAFTCKVGGLLAGLVGGLAMQAVGLALGGELPRGPIAAVMVSELTSAAWLLCGVVLVTREGQLAAGIFLLAAGLLMVAPTIFAFRCLLLMRTLPPVDRGRLAREAWEAYEKRRRH